MKCDFKCFDCEYDDCILSELEATEQEDKKPTYKAELNVDMFKTRSQIDYAKHKERYKAYRDAHKDKAKAYHKAYYEANKERIKKHNREKQRSRYLMNTENEREKSRRYYYANREKILAKLRAKTDEKRRLSGLVNDSNIVAND